MFRFIKKIFLLVLTNIDNACSHTKCVPLSNQIYATQPTLINLHPKEYAQGLRYYPFAIKLDRCARSFNTLNDLSDRVCVPNEAEDLNLSVFNMITGINKLKILKNHISCKCKCKFHGRNCNSNQKLNNNKCQRECKNPKNIVCAKRNIFGILLYVAV